MGCSPSDKLVFWFDQKTRLTHDRRLLCGFVIVGRWMCEADEGLLCQTGLGGLGGADDTGVVAKGGNFDFGLLAAAGVDFLVD